MLASSLLLGVFFLPLGSEVFAVSSASDSVSTSQTMTLLQANVLSVPLFKESNSKDNKKEDQIDPNIDVNIISDNALVPATGPVEVSGGVDIFDNSQEDQVSVYVIRKGDSISAIAKMFNVSTDTILAANDMKKGSKLVEGDVLFILPISGLEHTVAKGQTLQSIAKIYKVDVDDIIIYNDLAPDSKLAVGDKIIIPGAEMADEGGDKPASNLGTVQAIDKNYYATHSFKNIIGYFINPVPTGHKTQGLHGPGHRGIDIGAPTGTPIYASAPGKVLIVKTGCVVGKRNCGGGYGNMVIVQHSNGTKTLYGHMYKVGTHMGANVSRGEVIGYVGSTGHSTGPHIHFEVFNAKNPGADWSWAK